jgi:hypothetical protein
MKQKNGIKTPNVEQNTLRGTGKLDWTPAGKLHGTMARLQATFSDEPIKVPGKKDKVKCPGCGQKFKTNTGKIPKHKLSGWRAWGHPTIDGFCTQKKSHLSPLEIVSKVDNVEINGYVVTKGDTVAFTTYPWKVNYQDWHELKEHKVTNVYLMDNEKIYLELEDVKDNFIPVNMFAKNFIKL